MALHRQQRSRRWLVPVTVASAAIFGSLGLGTLGAYTASITNSDNFAGAGSLVMQETGPGADGAEVTCTSSDGEGNAVSCSTINKYGGETDMTPGQSIETTVTFANTGSVAANSFTLAAGQCGPAPQVPDSADACGLMNVRIADGATEVYNGTAEALSGQTFQLTTPVEPGAERPFTFTVTLSEEVSNDLQSGSVHQSLTWTFQA